jgi:hypothetical protein
MERWERRERKKLAEANRMKKSGMSVKLMQRLIGQRAADLKEKKARATSETSGQVQSPRR